MTPCCLADSIFQNVSTYFQTIRDHINPDISIYPIPLGRFNPWSTALLCSRHSQPGCGAGNRTPVVQPVADYSSY